MTRAIFCILLMPLLTSCFMLRSPSTPMRTVHYPAASGPAEGVVVCLPGVGDAPEDYEEQGFVEMIRAANPRMDVVAADAHFGYYRTATLVERLHADVIAPLSRRYDRVWVVGISVGGLGAAAYAHDHPSSIDGMILLAPYMGDREMIGEIKRAGGLAAWTPPATDSMPMGERRRYYEVWSFYRGFAEDPQSQPLLFLGCGRSDRLAMPNRMVTSHLPDGRAMFIDGGHRWTVWKELFADLVERAFGAEAAGGE